MASAAVHMPRHSATKILHTLDRLCFCAPTLKMCVQTWNFVCEMASINIIRKLKSPTSTRAIAKITVLYPTLAPAARHLQQANFLLRISSNQLLIFHDLALHNYRGARASYLITPSRSALNTFRSTFKNTGPFTKSLTH